MGALKTIAVATLRGTLLSAMTLLIEMDGCVCDHDRGLPLPVIRPSCGGTQGCYLFWDGNVKSGMVLDASALLINIVVWSLIAFVVAAWGRGKRGRNFATVLPECQSEPAVSKPDDAAP